MAKSPILEARSLQLKADSPTIDMQVYTGEIVGLIGLEGMGQSDFIEALCGVQKPLSGEVICHSQSKPVPIKSLHDAVNASIAYLPRNRKSQGILPPLSVYDNFALASLTKTSRFGFINKRKHQDSLKKYQERLSIKYESTRNAISTLSGGNQQKVLLARWLATNPRIMLLNDPTRGVDLRTRMTIYEVFKEIVAEEQTSLVVLSTEIEELLHLCDRVLIFRDFHIFTELGREDLTMPSVLAGMFGNVSA